MIRFIWCHLENIFQIASPISFLGRYLPRVGLFAPGHKHKLLKLKGISFGVAICYEALFPGILRDYVNSGAVFMINLSNEAWYSRGDEHHQHLAMTILGAVSCRIDILRVTNDGITAFISASGQTKGRVIERGVADILIANNPTRGKYRPKNL